jgi:cell wall-associated NlpC family hydrolase
MTKRKQIATFALACALLGGAPLAIDASHVAAARLPGTAHAATADVISLDAAAALDAIDTPVFNARLQDVASAVAARLEVDPAPLLTAWTTADRPHQTALLAALTQVGVPYRRNTSREGVGFDCSGLTSFAWGQAGYSLARKSTTQLRNSIPMTADTAQAGDLVYYPGHVMIWLGVDALIVHAPYRGHPVEVDSVSTRRVKRLKYGNPATIESAMNRPAGLA